MDEINAVISLVIIQLFTNQLLHRNSPLMPLEMFGFHIFAHSGRRMGGKKLQWTSFFQGPLQTCTSAILLVKKVIFAVLPPQGHTHTHTHERMHARVTHTAHMAHSTPALGPALSVLDLGWNGHGVYQSPAQPRTRENDAANNIITALVHISLIWQKSSLSGVSHMVHCSAMAGMAGGTNGRILGTFSVCAHGMSWHLADVSET